MKKILMDFSYVPIVPLDPEDKAVLPHRASILARKTDTSQGIKEEVYWAWEGISICRVGPREDVNALGGAGASSVFSNATKQFSSSQQPLPVLQL